MLIGFKCWGGKITIPNEFHWVWPILGCLGKEAYNFKISSEIEKFFKLFDLTKVIYFTFLIGIIYE